MMQQSIIEEMPPMKPIAELAATSSKSYQILLFDFVIVESKPTQYKKMFFGGGQVLTSLEGLALFS